MILGLFARIQLWQSLAMSLKAGYRIEDALEQAGSGHGPGARLARALRGAGRDSLAEAAAALPGRFSELEIALLQAGELSGRLPETIASLGEYLRERRKELGSLLVSVAYPVVVIHLAAFAGAFAPAFMQRGGLSRALFNCVLALLPLYGITFLLFALPGLIRRSGIQAARRIDAVLLTAPLVGTFYRHETLLEFYWLMGTLLGAGIPVREALTFAVARGTNHAFREELRDVEAAVHEGGSLAAALESARALPGRAAALLRTAEDTGNLAETFLTLFREAHEGRSLVGKGLLGALWAFYFALAVIYVLWAVLGFWGDLFGRITAM